MINPRLAKVLEMFDASPKLPRLMAGEDRCRTALLDYLSTLSVDEFINLAEKIGERMDQHSPTPTQEDVIDELAMFGWSKAVEALRERLRVERDLPDDLS